MKTLLTTFLLISIVGAFAQTPNLPIDSATHLITYSGIVNVAGNKDELYSRAREWFAKTYKSAQNVIQMDTKDKIVGKALMQVYYKGGDYGYINYTISIYLKDGKYKYEITDFYHKGEVRTGGVYVGNRYFETPDIPDYGACEEMMHEKKKHAQKVFNSLITQMDENIKPLIASINESMNKQIAKKDDF